MNKYGKRAHNENKKKALVFGIDHCSGTFLPPGLACKDACIRNTLKNINFLFLTTKVFPEWLHRYFFHSLLSSSLSFVVWKLRKRMTTPLFTSLFVVFMNYLVLLLWNIYLFSFCARLRRMMFFCSAF